MNIKKGMLAIFFFIESFAVSAQTGYDKFLNVLSDIPQLFQSWINKTDSIALGQDKQKFENVSLQIYRDLDKVILAKRQLLNTINNDSSFTAYQNAVTDCAERINDLKITLKNSERLSQSIGINAVKFSSELDFEFAYKEFLINDIIHSSNENIKNKRLKIIDDLNKGINVLQDCKGKIDSFITALEKK